MKIAWMLSHCLLFSGLAAYSPQVLSESPRIVWVPDFLTSKECDHLIKIATPYLERSTVLDESRPGEGKVDTRRTSQGMFFPTDMQDRTLRKIEKRIADLTHYPVENGEAIQVLHYLKGGEYQPHYDYFSANTPGGAASIARGGQRAVTVIMYLMEPAKGGETIFPSVKISVTPKKGGAVVFYNCQSNGMEDPLTLHGGAPVLEGEKWIATKWIRKGTFH